MVVKHKVSILVKQITIIKQLEKKLQLESKLKLVNKYVFGFLFMDAIRKDIFVFSKLINAKIVKSSKSK